MLTNPRCTPSHFPVSPTFFLLLTIPTDYSSDLAYTQSTIFILINKSNNHKDQLISAYSRIRTRPISGFLKHTVINITIAIPVSELNLHEKHQTEQSITNSDQYSATHTPLIFTELEATHFTTEFYRHQQHTDLTIITADLLLRGQTPTRKYTHTALTHPYGPYLTHP